MKATLARDLGGATVAAGGRKYGRHADKVRRPGERRATWQLLMVAMALAVVYTADDDPASAAGASSCAAPGQTDPCLERCVPGKLIFISCMAVGATQMAACREREIRGCIEVCRRERY